MSCTERTVISVLPALTGVWLLLFEFAPQRVKDLMIGLAIALLLLTVARGQNLTCGPNTVVDGDVCLCQTDGWGENVLSSTSEDNEVYLAAVIDSTNYEWAHEIIDFTVKLLNNHSNGWHDDLLNDGTLLTYDLVDSVCDVPTALHGYWKLREKRASQSKHIHGLFGAKCSGVSVALANLASLEKVPQVSPVTTAWPLSDKEEFPYFSRLCAPDDGNGGIGALIAMLRSFGWNRVSIIATNTQYANDATTEFRKNWEIEHTDASGEWTGEVADTGKVTFDSEGPELESIQQVLSGLPTDPRVKSRVIVLIAHHTDAYHILHAANEIHFQPDTIWVGMSWPGTVHSSEDLPSFKPRPGYLGVIPYRNQDNNYQDYLSRFQTHQQANGEDPWVNFDRHFGIALVVDTIIAFAMALSTVPKSERHIGDRVNSAIAELSFDGVSGHVSLNENRDRFDPQFSLLNYGTNNEWNVIATLDTQIGTATFDVKDVCFGVAGCYTLEIPSDKYPVIKVDTWVLVVMPIGVLLLVILGFSLLRSVENAETLKKTMTTMEKAMAKKKKIDSDLNELDAQVESAQKKKEALILERATLQQKPATWTETNELLVEVNPQNEQYWDVSEFLQASMTDAHISQLWRVQNTELFAYYSFHKYRLAMHGVPHNERHVWHGTSEDLDPYVIVNDRQDGFMMQFSKNGYWGRGIYFAENSNYSHVYSYKPNNLANEQCKTRKRGQPDEREIILAKLLAGSEVFMDRSSEQKRLDCQTLTVPPVDPRTGMKHNTVTGYTANCKVYVVYENGRALPDYLIRYYRGNRDLARTPFCSRQEAMRQVLVTPLDRSLNVQADEESHGGSDVSAHYEFLDKVVWKPYSDAHQRIMEAAYRSPVRGNVHIQTNKWKYEIDFTRFVQTNLSTRKERAFRRRSLSDEVPRNN